MITTNNNLIAAFDSLPLALKDWAGSAHTTYQIIDINDRLGLKNEKSVVISRLIFRLITQDLDPIDFSNELSYELGVSFQTAKSVASDIEEKILRPVEAELKKNVGVDSKLIYFGQPGPRKMRPAIDKIVKTETVKTPTPIEPIAPTTLKEAPLVITGEKPNIPAKTLPPFPTFPAQPNTTKIEPNKPNSANIPLASINVKNFSFLEKFSKPSDAQQPQPAAVFPTSPAPISAEPSKTAPAEESPATPFMVHEDDSLKTIKPIYTKDNPFLNINVDKYYGDEKKAAVKPTSIKLETDRPAPATNPTKVINYSTFKTAINESGAEKKNPSKKEDVINLETFTKVKGNEIDLRPDKK